MKIEALYPLRVHLEIRPGHPVDLPDDVALRLLEKYPDKARAVDPPTPAIQAAVGSQQPAAGTEAEPGLFPIESTLERAKIPFTATEPTVGQIVTWDSPLFGLLSGVVIAVSDQSITVFHPLSEQEATIPKVWCKWWISPETVKAIQRRSAGGDQP
jgi:hypothetical protein